ncbi:glycoprotein-N-acetylgalactosamine 3-beta-galactosyltransferase 1-like [Musca autumnalis]|uniref:glycoprotein-N-acetylgalactosamine 3-beta-galactosyltransferase 1-like n=1 Tax=Musca autumnalis TaxID=221902 RepID=UPI003CE99D92
MRSILHRVTMNEGLRSKRCTITSLIIGLIVGFCLAKYSIPGGITKIIQNTRKNELLAQDLYHEVRVLCWVLTTPENHETKAKHIKATWGKRCNMLLFMSSVEDPELGSIALPVPEGRDNLWGKTKEAFKYVYKHHLNDADWFMKADDDTYTIVENLRFLLYPYSPNTPIYFGCRYKKFAKQGYMAGGSGYVLSKEALRRFVEIAVPNATLCKGDNLGAEDVQIGVCLENINVTAGDSRDIQGRGKFFPFPPEQHLFPSENKSYWYWDFVYYKTHEGPNCCSDYAVGFHYIEPGQMHVLDYLIYNLRPYGITYAHEPLPKKIKSNESIQRNAENK